MNNHPKGTAKAEEAAAKTASHRASKTGVVGLLPTLAAGKSATTITPAMNIGVVSKKSSKDNNNNDHHDSVKADRNQNKIDTKKSSSPGEVKKQVGTATSVGPTVGETDGAKHIIKTQKGKHNRDSTKTQSEGVVPLPSGKVTKFIASSAQVGHNNNNKEGGGDATLSKKRKVEFDKGTSNANNARGGRQVVIDSKNTNTRVTITKSSSTATTAPTTATTTNPSSKAYTDIYGRNPGNEPNYTIQCPNNCGRHISCSRMALHLEKCLGLSTRRRNSTSASNGGSGGGGRRGSVNASSSSGGKGNKVGGGGKVSRQGKQAKRKSSKIII